jgi:dienelactone hydrolase
MDKNWRRIRRLLPIFVLPLGLVIFAGGPLFAQYEVDPETDLDAYFDREYSPEYEAVMVQRIRGQINRYFDGYTDRIVDRRGRYWNRDFSDWSSYTKSVTPNRERLRTLLGVVDERAPVSMETYGSLPGNEMSTGLLAETNEYTVHWVRWPVLDGIEGEGILLTPTEPIVGRIVLFPDADQEPEEMATTRVSRLVENGIQMIIPTLINRETTHSGSPGLITQGYWNSPPDTLVPKFTNEPHREWLYRHAYPMGRHIIGYEIQKALAAMDWFEAQGSQPIGVAGYGEGGLLAFYAGALEDRIKAVLVSGYYGPREDLWKEPVYRNVWGLLKEFGDAEIASLIAPRRLVVEYSDGPFVEGPPPQKGTGRGSDAAAPGRLWTPDFSEVQSEVDRLRAIFQEDLAPEVTFVHGSDGGTVRTGSTEALSAFARGLGVDRLGEWQDASFSLEDTYDSSLRQKRQLEQITRHIQRTMHDLSDYRRYKFLQGDLSSAAAWEKSMDTYRDQMYEEMIGRLEEEPMPPNPRRRQVYDREHWTGYEVVLDVLPGVRGWGLLALPKDLEEGEKRPVVVVQHGHLGIPTTPLRIDSYNRILPRLVERGFIVFAPFNPYQFNPRRATPVKATIFSVLIPQHQQIARWLQTLPNVDDERIGFYGKSWGGRSALRIPPYVPEYKLSICSAFFNNWSRKTLSTRFYHSILYNGSIGLYEWNQLNTFTHAEMAQLIVPRPFMVENGYFDGIKPDEWAGYEFAKVERTYRKLGIPNRAVFGTHVGGHEVHADTIFPFLHEHLNWPVPATK